MAGLDPGLTVPLGIKGGEGLPQKNKVLCPDEERGDCQTGRTVDHYTQGSRPPLPPT